MVEGADLGPLFENSEGALEEFEGLVVFVNSEGALEEFEGLVVEKEVLEDDLQVAVIAQIDCQCFSL